MSDFNEAMRPNYDFTFDEAIQWQDQGRELQQQHLDAIRNRLPVGRALQMEPLKPVIIAK